MANVPDPKKVQSMVNICGQQMIEIRAAVQVMTDIKAKFQVANPNVTGTPLAGNVAALNAAYTALKTEVDKAIWTNLIAAIVPTHAGKALD